MFMDATCKINVPYISDDQLTLHGISSCLDAAPAHKLNYNLWKTNSSEPSVSFSMAYNSSAIYLKYYVTETEARAIVKQTNGHVWEDSCVEFFIALDDAGYYNIEVNCAGVSRVGYGANKHQRNLLNEKDIQKYLFTSAMQHNSNGVAQWELYMVVSWRLFRHHKVAVRGRQFRANFYKCGDKLQQPHYLSWSNIVAEAPDFHLPQFFGLLNFE